MTYTPTEKQIEAAWEELIGVFAHGRDDVDSQKHQLRNALIAAHAAVDPVDTTEFEAALQAFALDVEVYGCIWYADDVTDVPVVSSRANVVDLYVKAATR